MVTLNPEVVSRRFVDSGYGIAHCDMLGVLVVSATPANMLRVFSSPKLGGKDKGFQLQRTLGGPESPFPMQFKFQWSYSGSLAFTGCAAARYLLVSHIKTSQTVADRDVVWLVMPHRARRVQEDPCARNRVLPRIHAGRRFGGRGSGPLHSVPECHEPRAGAVDGGRCPVSIQERAAVKRHLAIRKRRSAS
jgi:hypothetical protein